MPQIKFGFFLAFKQSLRLFYGRFFALFGFLLTFSSGNPVYHTHRLANPVSVLASRRLFSQY